MSDELPTGADFTLASHGLKPAPTEPEFAEPATYGAGIEGVREAANSLSRERTPPGSEEPIERHLEWKSGEKRGQRVNMEAERFSLTPKQAAQTLTEVHRTEDAIEAHANLSALAADVDLTRAHFGVQQPLDAQQTAQSETPPPIDSPQAEAGTEPSTPGMDPDFAALLAKKPALREQLLREYGQVEQARQQYTGMAQQAADVALNSLLVSFPELSGYSGPQLPTVIAHIARTDPERAALIEDQITKVSGLHTAAQQAKAQQAQIDQQRFQQWSKAQDAALEAKVPEIANDPDMKVSRAALKSLKDVGYTEQELAAAWNGVPFSMRDHRAQLLIWKAAQYDMAKANAHKPAPRELPHVMRPGVAPSAGERASVDLSELRNDFRNSSGNAQLRAAARLQQAQRRARG